MIFDFDSHVDIIVPFFDLFCSLCGLELRPKPAAKQNSIQQECITLLGLSYTFNRYSVRIEVPNEKVKKAVDALAGVAAALSSTSLEVKTMQKALGILNYVNCNKRIRSGSEIFRGLYPWTVDEGFADRVKNRSQRRKLKKVLQAAAKIIAKKSPFLLSQETSSRNTAHLFTDATPTRIGAILIMPSGEIYAYTEEISLPDYLKGESEQYRIDLTEALAVNVGLKSFSSLLLDVNLIIHIDNIINVYGHIMASTRYLNTLSIIMNTIFWLHDRDILAYYSYVKSELNPADAFTRKDLMEAAIKFFQPSMVPAAPFDWNIFNEQLFILNQP